MDDSADFQDKKSIVGPSKIKKGTDAAIKNKRKVKKIKGQKDIRTILKQNKSDLVKYSKEFNEVCQLSGIDVDSEQLQIAIALSKSLQNSDGGPLVETQTSETCRKQDSTSKIRTTLQEYGFKVPEIKLEKKNIRRKKSRKLYKLLTVSDLERQQIITDKYSQVLFENIQTQGCSLKDDVCQEVNDTKSHYHLATNVLYREIKDLNVFYVIGLLEISPNSIGTLLKDWLTIPGRPQSPCQNQKKSKQFSNLSCSQLELDKILSGSMVTAQSIVKDKIELSNITLEENTGQDHINLNLKAKSVMEVHKNNNCSRETLDVKTDNHRSCSPDIFDDEIDVTIYEDDHNQDHVLSTVPVTTFRSFNDFMNLTECAPHISQDATKNNILSQEKNVTRKKSNDFMEITNCIASSSQPILVNNMVNEHIALPLLNRNAEKLPKFEELIQSDISSVQIESTHTIDLTQDVLESKTSVQDGKNNKVIDKMDLTQSSDSNEVLPTVIFYDSNNRTHDDTIILEENEYAHLKIPSNVDPIEIESEDEYDYHLGPKDIKTVYSSKEEILDLTLEIRKSPNEEQIHNCSDLMENSIENINICERVNIDIEPINENVSVTKELHIDLTQNESVCNKNTSPKVSFGSLGKMDDVSVDYDEICFDNNSGIIEYIPEDTSTVNCDDNIAYRNQSKILQENSPPTSFSHNEIHSNDKSLSQQSDVFEISDNELDYSMQKSRLESHKENFQMGGISILDNISKRNSKSFYSNRISRSISESFLPEVDIIKKTKSIVVENPITAKSQPSTPFKIYDTDIKHPIETPKVEYIIKTDQVTPMLDYASLSTPERNHELEKYGLKPFKRKRAVQLLTHLYNQTHPIVEPSTESLPSPSKKLRRDINSQPSISPKKTPKSPKKAPNRCKSPIKDVDIKDNDVVNEETNRNLDIRHIECDPDDWVFQKREKAKIHSCRLPLHIAFHNYVSSKHGLREAILRYEPVQIDLIHKDFVAMGLKYDPKDLLKFLDKKCITVKTADNNSRNIKK